MEFHQPVGLQNITKKGNRHKSSLSTIDSRGQLRNADKVGLEACSLAFSLSREISEKTGAKVFVLNPGKLKVIYESTKKTDIEDALKLAKLIQRFPEEELPIVPLPTEREEKNRALISEEEFWTKERTRLINRLHSLYVRAGFTSLTKADLKSSQSRDLQRKQLTSPHSEEAMRLEQMLNQSESCLGSVRDEEKVQIAEDPWAPYVMSVPGVGPSLALAFSAFVWSGERFDKAGQVGFYAGLVPRIDCSGEKNTYGHITKHGCRALRRLAVLNSWILVNSGYGGVLKKKYQDLKIRRGCKIAIVAVARKLMELLWILVKNRTYYIYTPPEAVKTKLKRYGIKWEGSVA